eukprot:1140309-Pelagomonas_calceolata.AAC.1
MGMQFASKFIGTLPVVIRSQSLKLVKGMLKLAGPTNTQKDGVESHDSCTIEFACCRCAASNCCPGLVSSQYLILIECTCCWFIFGFWGCLTQLAVVVLSEGLCLLHNAWCEQEEEGEEEVGLA